MVRSASFTRWRSGASRARRSPAGRRSGLVESGAPGPEAVLGRGLQEQTAVVVHVAVIRADPAALDQPQGVRDQLDQVAVVADDDDRTRELVDRLDQGLAAVDVEMVGGLVEDQELGGVQAHQRQGEPGLLAAGQMASLGAGLILAEAEAGEPGAALLLALARPAGLDVLERALLGHQILDLVLGEEADLETAGADQLAGHGLQPAGDQLGEGRLAVAVAAEQRDAVVGVEAQGEAGQHGLLAIADPGALHGDHRRGRDAAGGEGEADLGLDQRLGDRLHALEHLDPALRLAGLAGLVAEAVDEGLDVGALGRLPLARLLRQDHPLAAGALEPVVAARVEGELPAFEMTGLLRHRVEKVAVVADQDQRARVAAQMLLEPDRGLEVEMVGGLVEQQEVGLEEQDADASATRIRQPPENEFSGRFCSSSSKPRPLRMRAARAGAASARMSCSRWCSSAWRTGSVAALASASSAVRTVSAASTACERGRLAARRFLADHADLQRGRHADLALRRAAARPRSGAAASTCRCRCGRPGPGAWRPGRAGWRPRAEGGRRCAG